MMDVKIEKFLSGEGLDYRVTLADGLLGYVLMLTSILLLSPFFGNDFGQTLHEVLRGEINVWGVVVVLLAVIPAATPIGFLLNSLSFAFSPLVRWLKFRFIHKVFAPWLVCGDSHSYFCECIPRSVCPSVFFRTASLVMALHRYAKDKNLLQHSVKMVDRMIGFYIFLRSLSLIMLIFSVVYLRFCILWSAILFLFFWLFLFLASLTDYYALTHIIRGLYGNYVVKTGTLPEFGEDAMENLLMLVKRLE